MSCWNLRLSESRAKLAWAYHIVMLNMFQHLTASLSCHSPRTDPELNSGWRCAWSHAELVSASHCEPFLSFSADRSWTKLFAFAHRKYLLFVRIRYGQDDIVHGVICYLYSHFGEANSMLLSNTRNHLSLLNAHYSLLKNLWSSVASVLSACNYWVMSKLTANAKKHKNPPQWGGFCASKGLILPLKTPFFGAFLGYFYRILQKYKILCRWILVYYN